MNQSRLIAAIEAYARALQAEIKLRPTAWLRFPGDKPDDKAIRVAVATHELIAAGSLNVIQTDSDAWKRTCKALRISQTRESIANYLEGAG